MTTIPELPNIPYDPNRSNMTPEERVESYLPKAQVIIDNLAEDPEDALGRLALSLSAAYVEGHQDGRTYGYNEGRVAGMGGPTPPHA